MKARSLLFSSLAGGIIAYAFYRYSRQLRLVYNEESGQLIIDLMRRTKCCNGLFIENLVITLNGEVYSGFDYSETEKSFSSAIFIEVPDLEPGDLIEVKMKTRCIKRLKNWGKLEIN